MNKFRKINSFIFAFGVIFLILRYTIGLFSIFENVGSIIIFIIISFLIAYFLNNGGYDRHFINLNFSEEKDEDLASMTYQKTIIDLENAKRVYKTYPSTRFMAITATIVSIILLFLKLAEVFGWIKKQ